ncbi:PREDICTED: protein misato homolog 1-like [Dinoponera quadriceps]|uniref:Protein misato homolog 1-like n=1 Tax=Dinoponera quadriceps TaxID=609295 RepID=A0A6P3WPT5_DINQU|nr:PREDICTED: protein misato homolog 1-like [Dinoponera quadriceps]
MPRSRSDVLYRVCENLQRQVTFTPRVLIANLKGGISSMYEQGILYDTEHRICLE